MSNGDPTVASSNIGAYRTLQEIAEGFQCQMR